MHNIAKKIARALIISIALLSVFITVPVYAACSKDQIEQGCVSTNIIFSDDNGCYCQSSSENGSGITDILLIVVNIMSGLALTLAIAGLIVAGIQYLTAHNSETQVVKAKQRIFQICLGLLAFALMWAFLNWLIPGGVLNNLSGSETSEQGANGSTTGTSGGSTSTNSGATGANGSTTGAGDTTAKASTGSEDSIDSGEQKR